MQAKLTPMREQFRKLEEAQLEESRNVKDKKLKKDKDKEEEKKETKQEPFWFPDGQQNLIF